MKLLRWIGAGLLWLVGGVVGLLGLVLTVTLILAPLGIPLLMVARRIFRLAGRLVIPRAVRHPLDELARAQADAAADLGGTARAKWRGSRKRMRKRTGRLDKKTRSARKQISKRSKKVGHRVRDRMPGS